MGMYEKFAAVIHREELTTAEYTALEQLVALANSSAGQFIRKESGAFVNSTTAEVISLSGLSDVSITSPSSGHVLVYNGSAWVNSAESGLGTVTSVGISGSDGISVTNTPITGSGTMGLSLGNITPTSVNIDESNAYSINGTAIISDAAGTATLSNIDALDATTEATIEAAIDTLANLVSIQGRTVTLADAGANAVFGWDDVAGAYENLTAGEVRGAIGLATSDSPQFTGIELGHASDTTLTRSSAGNVAIEGNVIYRASGTDVAVTDGGTGVSAITALSIWVANSANTITEVTPGAGNSIRINAGGTAWEAFTPSASVPTTITVANEATDTTCFIGFFTAATGDLGPKSNANLTFNSNTGVLTSASAVLTTADINGGTLDGVTIGGASAAAATFTTIAGTTLTLTDAASITKAGLLLTLTNSTDNASVQTAIFQGDRATMADGDEAYITFRLSDDGGTQTEVARFTWVATDVNAGTSVDGRIDFAVITAGSLADEMQLDGTALSPSTNDGLQLGTTSLGWADLHLATGGVINWANGEVTISAATDTITVAGATSLAMGTSIVVALGSIELGHASDTTIARSGAGDITIEGNAVYRAGGTDVAFADGGTGLSSWTQYLIPYAATTTSIGQIAIGTAGQVLTSNGAGAAPTFQAASGGTTSVSMIPAAEFYDFGVYATRTASDNTEGYFGLLYIPSAITVNKFSFMISAYTSDCTLDIGFYSQDGQTLHFQFTTDTITATGTKTKALSAQVISAGWYYIGVVPNSGNVDFRCWVINSPMSGLYTLASEPEYSGKLTGLTAGTLPATFDPTALTEATNCTMIFRLDN